ncbi:8516_t:CDS:2 [Funneliformis caledonium]|uniref:8516_t:CDS:1 n=1 Tax=Funneliformis caledonium TaxID=1117310 RepID=A0A9N9D6K5_9GLOM|nr:8516_t:CDS:2 [Funneliformis caledonium]
MIQETNREGMYKRYYGFLPRFSQKQGDYERKHCEDDSVIII